jgi:rhamnogalacturonan endolyase
MVKLIWVVVFSACAVHAATAWRPTTAPRAGADGYVLIRGGTFVPGDAVTSRGEEVRVDDFEILDHPVTNQAYAEFVRETSFPAPPHWTGGQIPAGMEKMPVTFVNRFDATAYTEWLSRKSGRAHRLPTNAEFEYAARAGLERKKYPWGDEEPDASKANFDPTADRNPTEWRRHLKPVKSYPPNGYGLHDMAGNVWQITTLMLDPGRTGDKYRATPVEIERVMLGGSWLRSKPYLRIGHVAYHSPGSRQPDVGFRTVREPAGATHFRSTVRRIAGVPQGSGRVFVSWQMLASDARNVGFNVYRTVRRDTAGARVNETPVRDSSNYLDTTVRDGILYYYRVRPVDAVGKEGPPSEWFGVRSGPEKTRRVLSFRPLARPGRISPIFGDLNGDGILDIVVRYTNGVDEGALDPGIPVEIEAFFGDGRLLWRRPLVHFDRVFGNSTNVPVVVADLDGDKKAEVITVTEHGHDIFLAVLDGLTGRELRRTPWPPMLSDFGRSSARMALAIAYLDGRNPAIVTQTGLYENEVFNAFDVNLRQLWEFRSTMETSGSGCHHIEIADVNGDGRDEVFDGSTLLNSDGTLRWSIYKQHADIVMVNEIMPERKGLEVFYAIETPTHAGAYVVDADTGKIVWKVSHEEDPRWMHSHRGWTADIWDGSPGREMIANRDGHRTQDFVVFTSTGKILAEGINVRYTPIEWDGDATREAMTYDGAGLYRFNGTRFVSIPGGPIAEEPNSRCEMVADLVGDYRDEVVCQTPPENGRFGIQVYMAADPITRRVVSRTEDRAYRSWIARNPTGGSSSYFEEPARVGN